MNHLPQLTEDEVHYICSVIPTRDAISYFQQDPKEFSKILPGFRASKISKLNVSNLLFINRNRGFISFFIEKHINTWLSQIQEHLNKCIQDGDSKDFAFLHTLPCSYFADKIDLYFKLINEEYSEEYITLFKVAVKVIKESNSKQEKLQEELSAKESDIKKLNAEHELVKSDLKITDIRLNERSAEIITLKNSVSDLEKLRTTIKNDEVIITLLRAKIQGQENTIQRQRAELSDARESSQQLEAQIRAELEKKQTAKKIEQKSILKPKRPSDTELFKDYLEYNLENIGVPANTEYCSILKEHLSKILFYGIPIVISRGVGTTLMKCVANTLIGQSNVKTLSFRKDLSIEVINSFLSSSGRIVCLDNFIGNYNETELLPLFDNYRDKVIFLTIAYERTICYVSKEFMRYCQYLNLNRITALSFKVELTEDPSMLEEVEFEPKEMSSDNRYASLLRDILCEFGYHQSLVEQKCAAIFGEQDLCRMLAFDVLPYCVDVLRIMPYNTSERFLKYAGDSGRCPYKNLFKGWFAQ